VLEVNRLLARSQVCRSTDEVLDVTEHWRTAIARERVDDGAIFQCSHHRRTLLLEPPSLPTF
jgi:hypothetical protein